MSARVLTTSLLDFGSSYWESPIVNQEMPGILSSGFAPTGKFGIGFFSIFMWTDRVTIITRRYDEAHRETRVLEFFSGVADRPILRAATPKEYLQQGGTLIRFRLNAPSDSDDGLLSAANEERWSLVDLVRWLCPAADVDIEVEHKGKSAIAVRAKDWVRIPGGELLKRLEEPGYERRPSAKVLNAMGKQLQIINDASGTPVARAAVFCRLGSRHRFRGVVTVDGFRHGHMNSINGVFAGRTTVAARDSAMPLVEAERLSCWATEQIPLLGEGLTEEDKAYAANVVLACHGHPADLPIALTQAGWLNERLWTEFARDLKEVLLVDFPGYGGLEDVLPHLTLERNVVLANEHVAVMSTFGDSRWLGSSNSDWKWWAEAQWSVQGAVIKALGRAWNVGLEQLLTHVWFFDPKTNDEYEPIVRTIGSINGLPFNYAVGVISRPGDDET